MVCGCERPRWEAFGRLLSDRGRVWSLPLEEVLAYFETLAYAELGSGVDAVELAQAAYGDVVLGSDGAQGVALLDFVGGSSR